MKKSKKIIRMICTVLCIGMILVIPAAAAGTGDPSSSLKVFMDILIGLVKIIGFGAALYGGVELGISFSSHDSAQRITGIKFLASGLLIYFIPTILEAMGVSI